MIRKFKETMKRMNEVKEKRGMKYCITGLLICALISSFFQGLMLYILDFFFTRTLLIRLVVGIIGLSFYWTLTHRKFYEIAMKEPEKKKRGRPKQFELDVYYDLEKGKMLIGEGR